MANIVTPPASHLLFHYAWYCGEMAAKRHHFLASTNYLCGAVTMHCALERFWEHWRLRARITVISLLAWRIIQYQRYDFKYTVIDIAEVASLSAMTCASYNCYMIIFQQRLLLSRYFIYATCRRRTVTQIGRPSFWKKWWYVLSTASLNYSVFVKLTYIAPIKHIAWHKERHEFLLALSASPHSEPIGQSDNVMPAYRC